MDKFKKDIIRFVTEENLETCFDFSLNQNAECLAEVYSIFKSRLIDLDLIKEEDTISNHMMTEEANGYKRTKIRFRKGKFIELNAIVDEVYGTHKNTISVHENSEGNLSPYRKTLIELTDDNTSKISSFGQMGIPKKNFKEYLTPTVQILYNLNILLIEYEKLIEKGIIKYE